MKNPEEISSYRYAIHAFDEANSMDPNKEIIDGEELPKELLYARRMSDWLEIMAPEAPETLKLAARCQHIERWVIPREEYPGNRAGYIKWRNALKHYHADRAVEILKKAGYDDDTIARVRDLVLKKGIKTDPEAQLLEDIICLVFLRYYFEEFALKHEKEKLIMILQKTWRKMSLKGREKAMNLDMPETTRRLVHKAVNQINESGQSS